MYNGSSKFQLSRILLTHLGFLNFYKKEKYLKFFFKNNLFIKNERIFSIEQTNDFFDYIKQLDSSSE